VRCPGLNIDGWMLEKAMSTARFAKFTVQDYNRWFSEGANLTSKITKTIINAREISDLISSELVESAWVAICYQNQNLTTQEREDVIFAIQESAREGFIDAFQKCNGVVVV